MYKLTVAELKDLESQVAREIITYSRMVEIINQKFNKVRIVSDFKLKGLTKPNSMTLEPINNENTFWAKSILTQERFDALFDYSKNNWKDKKIAEVEHDGIREDGTPINPVVISVREA